MEKITALEQFNNRMPSEIWRWRDSVINQHRPVMRELIAQYARDCRGHGYVLANQNLRRIAAELGRPMFGADGLSWVTATADDEEIRAYAELCAESCADIVRGDMAGEDIEETAELISKLVEMVGVQFPLKITLNDTPETIRDKKLAAMARTACPRWWRRQLRKLFGRQVEQVLRTTGAVQKRRQPYLSDWAFNRWKTAQKRNRELLASMEAVREEDGEEVSVNLADAVDASTANPVNRENEFYVRSRGFEEIADDVGMPRLFLTLTAPSKYHSRHHHGPRNGKYSGATPSEVQEYLCKVWQRTRADWKKAGIVTFGFRVVEPHHDGTPHWHMMLYFSESQIDLAWEIFRKKALKEDRDEVAGKERVRVDCKRLEVGESATGYLAKYLSKNITGDAIDYDHEAETTGHEGAARAIAWASTWGIRQFQQLGTVSVTVWRELRRRGEFLDGGLDGLGDVPLFGDIREAADKGDWRTFVELMGGPTVPRKEQTIRPQRLPKRERNAYGEEADHIRGVIMRGAARFIKTRLHEWKIRRGNSVIERDMPVADRGQLMPSEKLRGEVVVVGPSRSEFARAVWRASRAAKRPALDLCQ
ncbi:replication endonuclease [Microbulbifer sp. ZKSA002]|uniref:replication endonuclease n=1 Tax=Microbulbifer sp. ZKSA002 TaxID=3243388 RepID=UPI0040393A65